MLAGDRAAELECQRHHLSERALGVLAAGRVVRVEEDAGVQVAVTGVPDMVMSRPRWAAMASPPG